MAEKHCDTVTVVVAQAILMLTAKQDKIRVHS
jgi:hypothetical protein